MVRISSSSLIFFLPSSISSSFLIISCAISSTIYSYSKHASFSILTSASSSSLRSSSSRRTSISWSFFSYSSIIFFLPSSSSIYLVSFARSSSKPEAREDTAYRSLRFYYFNSSKERELNKSSYSTLFYSVISASNSVFSSLSISISNWFASKSIFYSCTVSSNLSIFAFKVLFLSSAFLKSSKALAKFSDNSLIF